MDTLFTCLVEFPFKIQVPIEEIVRANTSFCNVLSYSPRIRSFFSQIQPSADQIHPTTHIHTQEGDFEKEKPKLAAHLA